jgi:hypothetical protein
MVLSSAWDGLTTKQAAEQAALVGMLMALGAVVAG